MSFDSVFNGDPTQLGVVASGKASNGIDVATGQVYYKDDAVGGWQKIAGGSGGSTSDDVTNESTVPGATVTDALNSLGGGGTGVVHSSQVILTAAEMNALGETPQTLVPSPGVGKVNVPMMFTWEYDFSGAAFDISQSPALIICYALDDGQEQLDSITATNETWPAGFLNQTQSLFVFDPPVNAASGTGGGPILALGICGDSAIELVNGNGPGSDLLEGGTSTVKITTYYITLTL
jgi:hypothetical protein